MSIRVAPIPLNDLTFVGFGDCGWGVRRDGSSQGGSFVIAADPRKSLSDVESIFEKQHKSPVITDAKNVRCSGEE